MNFTGSQALTNNVKFAIYRQAIVLKNTAVHLPWSLKASFLTYLSNRMQVAGYNVGVRGRVISEGTSCYMKKVISSVKDGTPIKRYPDKMQNDKMQKTNKIQIGQNAKAT